jgi:hypothetical protein
MTTTTNSASNIHTTRALIDRLRNLSAAANEDSAEPAIVAIRENEIANDALSDAGPELPSSVAARDLPICYSMLPTVTSPGSNLMPAQGSWAGLIAEYHESAANDVEPETVWVHNLIEFQEGKRRGDAAIRAHGVIVETDGAVWTIEEIERTLRQHSLMAAIYTTKSHTVEESRFRVVIPLAEPIPADRYGRLVRHVEALLGGQFDSSARRVTQFQRMPTYGATVRTVDGQPLDPSRAPGATDHGEPLVPAGLRFFPTAEGPQVLGPVSASEPPAFVAKLLHPEQAQRLSEPERIAGLLGQVCVAVRDEYYIRQPNRAWVPGTRGNALSLVKEHWNRVRETGVEIEPKQIDAVFRANLIPTMSGVLASPVAADFVQFQGRRYLNVGLAPRIAPTAFGDEGKLLFEFIVRNICSDDRDLDLILTEANKVGAEPTATRWLLHWIAHQYQHPGVPLSTALWVISVEQGIGKTLFGELLRDLLGRANTTAANAAELKGEWSDWQVAKTLIVADEINVIERQSFYASIKRWIGSPTISIRQRNVGQYEIPATANWLFFTNELRPIALDAADRRNMMMEATNDRAAAEAMIERIRPILNDRDRRLAALAELGAWLDQVQVDSALIQRALPTDLKDDIIDTTRNPTDRWIAEMIEAGRWQIGQFVPFNEMFEWFQHWAITTGTFKGSVESRVFQSGLQVAKRRGWVCDERRRLSEVADNGKVHTPQKRGWVLVELPPGVVSPDPGAPTTLDAMRARREHRHSAAEWFHGSKIG